MDFNRTPLHLNCNNNNLTSLDVSNNINLTDLKCFFNQLSSLDISNNINLTLVDCNSNYNIEDIDLSNCPNLSSFDCGSNAFEVIDVSNNVNLLYFDCSLNQLNSLNVSSNTNLETFYCNTNNLTTLDISNNFNLNTFGCSYNSLTDLDVSNNINLTSLSFFSNLINSFDVSNNINLYYLGCGNNQLVNFDISNNINLTTLDCRESLLNSLDIIANINITTLNCSGNNLANLDISNQSLEVLTCRDNQLNSIDLSNSPDLFRLECNGNNLTNLDLSSFNLKVLWCGDNQLSTLDLSNSTDLIRLNCENNVNLEYINLKNGLDFLTGPFSSFSNLPNLQTVCVDELDTGLTAFISDEVDHPVTYTMYCDFDPAQSNTIEGSIYVDLDNNGCDAGDNALENVFVTTSNGSESFGSFTLTDAYYYINTDEGDFSTSLTSNLPSYWTVSPNTHTNSFVGFDNTFTADFCVTHNQIVNDVNISLIPLTESRPGFDTRYQLVYKNVGSAQINGTVVLSFDDTKLVFLNASETISTQTSTSLTFDYLNLDPFETRTIDFEFNVFTPPTVNINDVLNFTTTINPIISDFTTDDNVFELNQTVMGSFDPNDITCLEGDEILVDNIDKYLHYIIRFQNTGSANAINVVVTNVLDVNLDWTSLELENSSHDNRVVVKNGNEIEFIFEDINLQDSTANEMGSHGYIAYKIKPRSDISAGDFILSKADIFFDYNEAVETNVAITTVVADVAVKEQNSLLFSLFPTPTSDVLNIKLKSEIVKVEIYSILGKLVLVCLKENKLDVSNLIQFKAYILLK